MSSEHLVIQTLLSTINLKNNFTSSVLKTLLRPEFFLINASCHYDELLLEKSDVLLKYKLKLPSMLTCVLLPPMLPSWFIPMP